MTPDHHPTRADYRFFAAIPTRWSDNDMFGHVNNVEYYRFFEAVITALYHGPARLDLHASPVIPFAAETGCRFRFPLSFPETVEGGLVVEHVGTSSIRFGIGLFRQTVEQAAAHGHWVHVFVDRATQKSAPIPDDLRAVFEGLRA